MRYNFHPKQQVKLAMPNCKGILAAGLSGPDVLLRPQEAEPMFDRLKRAGFSWIKANSPGDTTRLHPWDDPGDPLKKIDWFFSRNLTCASPEVIPALDGAGTILSDHEMIVVDILL